MEIKHYLGKLFEHPALKTIVSLAGIILSALFGDLTAPLKAFLFLLIADYLTGMWKATKNCRVASWLSKQLGKKLITYATVIFCGWQLQQIGIAGIRDFIILWAGMTEGISIIENLDEIGIYIPPFIKERLLQTKQKKFGGS